MITTTPPVEESWNLADIFPDDQAFEQAKRELRAALPTALAPFRGRLIESATTLADGLTALNLVQQRLQRIQCYASMNADADTRDARRQAVRHEAQLLSTEFGERAAFFRPEIVAMDRETLEEFLETEPRLLTHAHFLRDLLRQKDHVLGPAEERIVAESSLLSREPASLYQTLTDADLPRREIELSDGQTVRLTPANFHKHRSTAPRVDRLRMFPAYFAAYAAFERTLGQNLYAAVKSHMFRTRVRGYRSCLAAALDPDAVPESVYRNLIEQVHERLPALHRYFRLRSRALGLERLDYSDLYTPLVEPPSRHYTVATARQRVLDGMKRLGDDYVSILDSAFSQRWIDWRPTPGKRSGAYSNGWAYRVHPFVLLNFNEDHDGVMTLAHEMGHALHSYLSNREQPFPTASYSIFVAEVASTLNEALLRERMQQDAASREERLFLLNSYLDGLRGTLFRQTMFAEFELEIHERAERGEGLTGEKLSEIYLRLLRFYHGHDQGVMEIAEDYALEWAAIPHMYYDFYVYQYATGIVAATALARGILEEREGALAHYLGFLSAGGSDYPLALLRGAGVDLERAEPYHAAFQTIDDTLDRLEEGLG